ncbi:YgdI/YgdR family lipoprotein [Salmonella enterica subsp. enterica serovar Cerro]|nr:YgdI/YgdR family lipoprotein [Salmonella enterica subsp. enterica serovar Cerro]
MQINRDEVSQIIER